MIWHNRVIAEKAKMHDYEYVMVMQANRRLDQMHSTGHIGRACCEAKPW